MLEVISWLNAHGGMLGSIILAVELLIGASPLKSNSTIALVVNGLKKAYSMFFKKEVPKLG